MFKLAKSEISYFIWIYISIGIMLICFALFSVWDIKLFENSRFLSRYFWSAIIGLGCYAVVFAIWTARRKENRDRQIMLLPLTVNHVSRARLLFGLSPFLMIFIFLMVFRLFASSEWKTFIDRINAQTGLFFILLSAIALIFSLNNKWLNDKLFIKLSKVIFILAITILPVFFFLSAVTFSVIPAIPVLTEEFYFYLTAVFVMYAATVAFRKQESYLI